MLSKIVDILLLVCYNSDVLGDRNKYFLAIKKGVGKIKFRNCIEVTNITLLTVEEVRVLPPDIRCYCGWWWLRSPGFDSRSAVVCCAVGTVDYYGYEVDYFNGTVRPALTLSNLDSEPLEIGEEISIAGKNYIAIDKDRVLYNDKPVLRRFDKTSNEYEKSEIKKFVDAWFDIHEKIVDAWRDILEDEE